MVDKRDSSTDSAPKRHVLVVEFFGIPRQRTGQASVELAFSNSVLRLGDVATELTRQFPALQGECILGERLAESYVFSVGGESFVRDPNERIEFTRPLLLVSADAGG